jgi:aminopeptidase N
VEIAARVAGLEKRVDAGAIDDRLLRLEAALEAHRDVADRLNRLEAAAESEETDHEIAALRGQLAGLAAQIEARQADDSLAQRLDELRTRVFAYEAQAGEAADRAHGMARMLGRLSTSNAEATAQAEARMHKLELAVAELRVEPDIAGVEAIQELDQRVTAFEARQADTFERLRADIAHFLGENDRRLEALENAPAAEGHDVANEFDALRRRIEERILGVEQRSIRALEQVADTMAVLEKRVFAGPEAAARSA